MRQGELEITFNVDARQGVIVPEIDNASAAQQLSFSGFEVAEHGGVVDTAASVRIDEANTSLEVERRAARHSYSMQQAAREVGARLSSISDGRSSQHRPVLETGALSLTSPHGLAYDSCKVRI